ncbi:hypothetical protein FNV43_RR19648 [Rhamnella rubrinervis]|uniref:Uncharacterized protein n=1 Tax=Rhamnella rubrinervis TaxID=2594499 RepID=A0A8K0DTE3_9ROSA|nr:hypothetical protein FNV43_RR19648 [Rhamnella rubrinervis]
MDAIDSVVDPLRDFAKDIVCLVKRCNKPDHKEFTKAHGDGIRWLFHDADIHSDQQHHRWLYLGWEL